MKKILSLMSVIMLVSMILCSCSPDEQSQGGNGTAPTPVADLQLVYAEGADSDLIDQICQ